MPETFFVSDTHFGHSNMLKFKRGDGSSVRPFGSLQEMDETMIDNWNRVVRPEDKVYHLGDFAIASKLHTRRYYNRLSGVKRLCVGNHDKIGLLSDLFPRVYLWRVFKEYGFVASHIPLRKDQMRGDEVNVHGHVHTNVLDEDGYFCVCVENTNYTPVHLDTILAYVNQRKS